MQEVEALRSLPKSKYLVHVVDDFIAGPKYCIVMNFCEGGTLDGLICKRAKQIKAKEDKDKKKTANGFGLLEHLRIVLGLARGLQVIQSLRTTHDSPRISYQSPNVHHC